MPKRILVPLDGSDQSHDAFEYALEEFPGEELTLFHVIDPIEGGYTVRTGIPISSEEWYAEAKADAEALFEEAREGAGDYDGTIETAIEVGRPSRTIVEHAADEGFDQIVMGSHGRSGVSRIVLGSVAENVVRRSAVPVTVVR